MTSEEAAIADILSALPFADDNGGFVNYISPQTIETALSALREKQERENPKPLTLDELREMDGQPVWVKHRAQVKFGEPWGVVEEWMIVGAKVQFLRGMNRSVPFEKLSPSEAIAYRSEPKEEQDER